jgi:integrase
VWRGHFWQRDFSRRSLGARFLQSLRKDDGTNFGENPWHDIKKRNVASVDPEEGAAYSELVETLIENLGLETTARNRRSIEMVQLVLAIGIWDGLRPSEIAALRYEDIDLDKGTILVFRGHVYGKTKPTTKTGKERLVYYLSPLAGRLRLWFSENQKTSIHEWLFENRDGNPFISTPCPGELSLLSPRSTAHCSGKTMLFMERVAASARYL